MEEEKPRAMEKLLMVTILILALGGMLSVSALLFSAAPGEVFVGTLTFLLIVAVLVNTIILIRIHGTLTDLIAYYLAPKTEKKKRKRK